MSKRKAPTIETFKWGKLLRKVKDESDRDLKHYSSFALHGHEYGLNDDVNIQPDRVRMKSDRVHHFWPAKITGIWQEADGKRRIMCRWYVRPEDLTGMNTEFCEHELLESNHEDEADVETIVCHATVCESQTECLAAIDERDQQFGIKNPRSTESSDEDDPDDEIYWCAKMYDYDTRTLREIVRHKEQPHLYGQRNKSYGTSSAPMVPLQQVQLSADGTTKVPAGKGNATARDVSGSSAQKNNGVAKVDAFMNACLQLQLSATPDSMPCRNGERDQIYKFCHSAVKCGGLGCALYISGMPGTGKTATVMEVVKRLQREHASGKLPKFQFVELNGMKLPKPQSSYTVLWKALTGEHVREDRAALLLEQRFASKSSRKSCVLLLVDELDHMVTRKQKVLYNLFNWPTLAHSRLVVVGIANTMDLPERLLPRVASRLGMRRIVFEAYNRQQIATIIEQRLKAHKDVFDPSAVEMAARKVSSLSGDIRRALQICRRAAEKCRFAWQRQQQREEAEKEAEKGKGKEEEREKQQQQQQLQQAKRTSSFVIPRSTKGKEAAAKAKVKAMTKAKQGKKPKKMMVTIDNITSAAKELASEHHMAAMARAPLVARILLIAVALEVRRLECEQVRGDDVLHRFRTLCSVGGLLATLAPKLADAELRGVLRRLGQERMLVVERLPSQREPMVSLACQMDDLVFALHDDKLLSRHLPAPSM